MPLSSKFPAGSTGEKIVKIGQYLAKIWTKCNSLLFWATLYMIPAWILCFYAQQPLLLLARLSHRNSVRPSVRHTGESVQNGAPNLHCQLPGRF